MVTTILLIITAVGFGIYHTDNKPTEYELNMEDGSNTYVVLQKNSSYACPLYCKADHIHHAVICKNSDQITQNQFVYHISVMGKNDVGVYCSLKKFISMNKITPKTIKEDTPDIVTASNEN